ncbi:cytochrome c [Nitrosococcus wardiae]|uniref:Cytochrome c n=1 Tax=Nitrosococcus wardiae TaxID=1814290 RepID=A0A4P7BYR6_9GAMM|nr:cytochrome c [Nitrosococcus wardiae]
MSPGETGEGLTPEPPELSETVSRWSAEELFWIINHGIRMTGMPAWGVSYQDEVLWTLVAFVQTLPEITPAAYQKMAAAVKQEPHEKAPITLTDQLTFKPQRITIQEDETLVWKNTSTLVHTVTADPTLAMDPKDVKLPQQAKPFNSGIAMRV